MIEPMDVTLSKSLPRVDDDNDLARMKGFME
jgi:hypothetical protein